MIMVFDRHQQVKKATWKSRILCDTSHSEGIEIGYKTKKPACPKT